jgi:hypothetical protein
MSDDTLATSPTSDDSDSDTDVVREAGNPAGTSLAKEQKPQQKEAFKLQGTLANMCDMAKSDSSVFYKDLFRRIYCKKLFYINYHAVIWYFSLQVEFIQFEAETRGSFGVISTQDDPRASASSAKLMKSNCYPTARNRLNINYHAVIWHFSLQLEFIEFEAETRGSFGVISTPDDPRVSASSVQRMKSNCHCYEI